MERIDKTEFRNMLEARTKDFAVETFVFLDALPLKGSTRVISFQLGKSASSIGANYREANRAESRDDFIHKMTIALKDASESAYWFEILKDLYPTHEKVVKLADESADLRNLFQSIAQSARAESNNLKS